MEYNYQEPLEYILRLIVNNPDELEITQKEEGTVIDLFIKANPSDYGIIIGRGGERIKNIKKILTVKAVRDGVKLNIHVDDDNNKQDTPAEQITTEEQNTTETEVEEPENIETPEDSQETEGQTI